MNTSCYNYEIFISKYMILSTNRFTRVYSIQHIKHFCNM